MGGAVSCPHRACHTPRVSQRGLPAGEVVSGGGELSARVPVEPMLLVGRQLAQAALQGMVFAYVVC